MNWSLMGPANSNAQVTRLVNTTSNQNWASINWPTRPYIIPTVNDFA
jgi:hypothetical protein